jgi:hypothetical protein
MKIIRVCIILCVLFFNFNVLFAQEYNQKDLDDLNKISRLIGKELDVYTLNYIDKTSKSKNAVVSAIAYTALFVNNQKKYQNSFYDSFSINDYAEREKGNYNFLHTETLAKILQETKDKAKGDKDDERILLLMAFMNIKNENFWIKTSEGNISISRLIRGMYFASSFNSSKIDPEEEANNIDEYTQKKIIP